VHAHTPVPANGTPAGLSAGDWAQISALLPIQEAYLKASDTWAGDEFGYSIAISGDTVVVGSVGQDNVGMHFGAAYVFVREGGVWSQQAHLKASNAWYDDEFGWSVAISGDTVVVGAPYEDSAATGVNGDQNDNSALQSGAAYVFVRAGDAWSQQAYLKASNTGAVDEFGRSVSISGDTVVVGAPYEDSAATGVDGDQNNDSALRSGAAYVFIRSEGIWSQQAYLKASNTGTDDRFGSSVAISGETVVVGAYLEDSSATGVDGDQNNDSALRSGAAYVFVRSGDAWSQQAYLKASNTGKHDHFGGPVAISGDTVVVGADLEDSSTKGVNGDQTDNLAPSSGAAYAFVREGGVWSQQAYLKASNTEARDLFGSSVAISGDTIVIGAQWEDSAATGVNGNQKDNSAPDSGAAYVFVRTGSAWSQQAYLKASNTGAVDEFGHAVAISGNTVVVGANQEDSGATGVNGDQNDNSALDSGAAYAFLLKEIRKLTLRSIAAQDGWILESSEISNKGGSLNATQATFQLGDDAADRQHRAILSFNTAALPDNAVITKVQLKIKQQGLVGTNPFTILGGLKADIRKPYFGTSPGLQVGDFQADPSKSAVGTFGKTPASGWYIADIASAGWPSINLGGITQFRLRFAKDDNDDMGADFMKFYSGNAAAANRPLLIIEYYVR
jgi:hypothetical protein